VQRSIDPTWSPDGTKIAFMRDRADYSDGSEIYVTDADGSNQTRLTNNSANDSFPAWSPVPHSYAFNGFFRPVGNSPTLNVVEAGRAVPMKFSLGRDEGLDIFAEGYPKSQRINCFTSAPLDGIAQTVSAGEGGLSYDPTTERYTYGWKTTKAWSGTCRQFVMMLDDGTIHRANFKYTYFGAIPIFHIVSEGVFSEVHLQDPASSCRLALRILTGRPLDAMQAITGYRGAL
jgi:Tol biopolymer transport system component